MKKSTKLIVLSILFTSNNILYALTKSNGDVIFWTSSGCKKSTGAKKITSTSILVITKQVVDVFKLNYKYVYIKFKGFGKNKKIVTKYLKQLLPNILFISDETTFAHNGCKKPKIRRI